ncbi:RICIN domain-containing protein [Streptomyces sp. AC627_RSS907]|uniref:RICIN domain-containing protein n=1 Tax=Streptomyces sp. AC627_RSS907 TaxID=2823684 RepID=UPI001C2653D6|nr:RICIN domain-containing protein [Streptomyces sp. AC627_RSS907]
MRKVVGIVGGLALAVGIATVAVGSAQGASPEIVPYKLKKGDQCLVATSGGAVTMGSCSSPNAVWTHSGPEYDMKYNKGTGKCLEAQDRFVKTGTCNVQNANQRNWHNIPAGATDGYMTVVPSKYYQSSPTAKRHLTKWDGGSLSLEKSIGESLSTKAVWKWIEAK